MSRSKRKHVAKIIEPEEQVSKTELLFHQQVHLAYLEQISFVLPKFHNISVVQGLTYELIQVINNAYLTEVLP